MSDEQQTGGTVLGWLAAAGGLLLALIAWGREWFKQRHETKAKTLDITQDFTSKMLQRIEALEAREKSDREEAQKREAVMQARITKVEEENLDCQKQYAELVSQHKGLHAENDKLREDVKKLRGENVTLGKQAKALADELATFYKQMGLKRSTPPQAVVRPPSMRKK